MNTETKLEVLFLCAHNAARSLMAEAILNQLAAGRFQAYSAGVTPLSDPHPLTIEVLEHASIPCAMARCKSWENFTGPHAAPLDIVITMSDRAAALEALWPGDPVVVHWRFPDPLEAEGTEAARLEVFRGLMVDIHKRLELMVSLPAERLHRLRLREELAGLHQP